MWWYFCSLKGAASSRDRFLLLKNTTAKIILTLVSRLSGEFIKLCSKNLLPIKFATDSKRWKIEKRKRRSTSFRNLTCSPVHSRHIAFTGNCRAMCFGICSKELWIKTGCTCYSIGLPECKWYRALTKGTRRIQLFHDKAEIWINLQDPCCQSRSHIF